MTDFEEDEIFQIGTEVIIDENYYLRDDDGELIEKRPYDFKLRGRVVAIKREVVCVIHPYRTEIKSLKSKDRVCYTITQFPDLDEDTTYQTRDYETIDKLSNQQKLQQPLIIFEFSKTKKRISETERQIVKEISRPLFE